MSRFKYFLSTLFLLSVPFTAHAQQTPESTPPAMVVQPAVTPPVEPSPMPTPAPAPTATTVTPPTPDVVELPIDTTPAPETPAPDQSSETVIPPDPSIPVVAEEPVVEEKPLTQGTATLDLYSGKPNPTWTLTPEQADEALAKVAKLPKNNMPYQRMVKLGYRGTNVKITKDGVKKPIEIICEHGVVIRQMDGKVQNFSDDKRAFELWLVQTGKGKVDKSVFTPVVTEIKGPTTILK